MARDVAFEREFLGNLKLEAGRRYGIDIEPLVSQIWARLERGDAVFGDQHMTRENLPEALEEYADGLAYVVFDCEQARGTEDYDDAPELFNAMLGLAQVDAIVRDVKNKRRLRRVG